MKSLQTKSVSACAEFDYPRISFSIPGKEKLLNLSKEVCITTPCSTEMEPNPQEAITL